MKWFYHSVDLFFQFCDRDFTIVRKVKKSVRLECARESSVCCWQFARVMLRRTNSWFAICVNCAQARRPTDWEYFQLLWKWSKCAHKTTTTTTKIRWMSEARIRLFWNKTIRWKLFTHTHTANETWVINDTDGQKKLALNFWKREETKTKRTQQHTTRMIWRRKKYEKCLRYRFWFDSII